MAAAAAAVGDWLIVTLSCCNVHVYSDGSSRPVDVVQGWLVKDGRHM